MNDKALRILEYTKIIDLLCEQAASDMGKELCRKLTPMTDIDDIKRAQRETSDALFRIVKKAAYLFQVSRMSECLLNVLKSVQASE